MLGPKSTAGEKLAQYPQDNRLPQGLAVCEQVFEGGPIPAEADRQLKSIAQVRENNEKNTSFVDCSYHSDFGGGVFGNSSGITLTIDSSTFISNSATMGGGIYIACPAIITRTAILSNTASTLGGGIRIDSSHYTVIINQSTGVPPRRC